jgi:hypothetical protein
MSSSETCIWTGATGSKYTYYVYERHPSFNAGQDGNYVYAKKNGEGKWVPVYFGEGDLSKRATTDHHRIVCIGAKQATHVHVHLNAAKDARRAEETDLLKRFTNAIAPSGCNISPTG